MVTHNTPVTGAAEVADVEAVSPGEEVLDMLLFMADVIVGSTCVAELLFMVIGKRMVVEDEVRMQSGCSQEAFEMI